MKLFYRRISHRKNFYVKLLNRINEENVVICMEKLSKFRLAVD